MDTYYRIYNKLFSTGQSRLRKYEAACVHAFWRALGPAERMVFQEQLRRYDRVQRSPNGKHLAFFDNESDGLCKTWPEGVLFRRRSDKPLAAAKAVLRFQERGTSVEAEIFVYAGRFAGIEFLKKPPMDGAAHEELELAAIRLSEGEDYGSFIERCQLLYDPGQEM